MAVARRSNVCEFSGVSDCPNFEHIKNVEAKAAFSVASLSNRGNTTAKWYSSRCSRIQVATAPRVSSHVEQPHLIANAKSSPGCDSTNAPTAIAAFQRRSESFEP